MSDLDVPPSLLRDLLDELLAAAQRSRPHYDAAMTKGGKKSGEKSTRKILKNVYQAELFRLQTEFVRLQEWARETGARIVIVFEGRDAAGKGGPSGAAPAQSHLRCRP
jgi:polyphosphate kinase 2 (PPK2 family)